MQFADDRSRYRSLSGYSELGYGIALLSITTDETDTRYSAAVFVLAACSLLAQSINPDRPVAHAKPNGYVRAENGLFSLSGDILCAFSSNRFGAETHCYKLFQGEWKPFSAPRSARRAEYLDFAPCDPLNQLNVGMRYSELAALLPRSATIKQVIETDRAALVAYSDSPEKQVEYSVRVAVLLKNDGHWQLASSLDSGAVGFFCGMRWLNQPNGAVALVYINEPAGSSDYNAIRSYWISWRR